MPITPISITNDLAMPVIPLGMTFHDVTPPPPAPPIPAAPCVEPPVMMMWPPGYVLFQNKLSTTVLHKAMPVVLDGHNCGYMLPHISIPPANLLTPLQIAFSSRKVAFSASTSKANGKPIACVFPSFLMPMTCCAQPVTLPNGIALLNVLNTVIVGCTWMDFFLGWLSIGLTMLIDKIFYKPPQALGWKALLEKMLKDAKWKLLLGDKWQKALAKAIAGAAVGAVKILATGEGSISISVGSNYIGGSVSYSRTREGANSFNVGGNLVTHQAGYQYTRKADGSSTSTTTTSEASMDNQLTSDGVSQTTSSSTTTRDRDGNVVNTSETNTSSSTRDNPWSGSSEYHSQKTTTTPDGTTKRSTVDNSSASRWGKPL
jgi:hypothetical protein